MSSSSWTDLATGDEHSVTDEPAYRSRGKLVDNRFYAWRTKDADWSARAPKDASGPITVNEYEAGYLGFGAFGGNQTPVEFLGEVLRRASRSEGELTETTPERGVPVVIATAPSTIRDPAARGARLYLSVWITREEQPRILRTATEMRCASGDPCDPSPADGKDDVQPFGASETLVWTVHPRTPETLAKVALPPDGGRFKLNPR
ncbi:MAG: hypothetical protein JHD16_15970 [Solirubrobacteraceae bacterium]|nr:hypothetical protein [Solirubrobacteraceae bacterium]